MRDHLQQKIRPQGGETESCKASALGVVPPDEAEDYAMPDDLHPETGNTQCADAGCGRADGTHVHESGNPEAFPEIKFTFSLSGLLLGVAFAFYPTLWLKQIVARRHLSILKALPNVLDLLTLSVEAGKDFLTALRDIMARRKVDPLGEELNRVLHEIQLGKGRQTALKEMSERVRQPELSSVVNAIVQADELGVSIGQLLRIQGDQLRNKRFVRAEKLANEAPVKILFPVVVFIFPSVFIILIGPIVYQALRTLAR